MNAAAMIPPDQPDANSIWSILNRAQSGDRSAFGELYDRYTNVVYRFIYWRVAGNVALAEDLTSETFLRALRAIQSFEYQGKDPLGWFLTIARNLVLDHMKSARNRLEAPSATPEPVVADPTSDLEEEALGRLTLAAALASLAAEQRECVVLRLLTDLSVADTARIMGKSQGAVKALQFRALKNLAAYLSGGTPQR